MAKSSSQSRKPGKYDHLFHKFKRLPPQDVKHQEKINLRKISLRICPGCEGAKRVNDVECGTCNGTGEWTLTATRLASLYINARIDVETIALAASYAGVELEAITQLLIDSQENKESEWGAFGASDRAMKLTNGDSIRVQPELYGTIKSKHEFRTWCFKNGQQNDMELPEKKTQDLVKDRAVKALNPPDGVEIFTRARIVYTQMKTEVTATEEQSASRSDDDTTIF